jgi:DHA1 family bicyclomycin/chloramphenicol resistance-like MFS transporter
MNSNRLSTGEFVIIIALNFSLIAFSIDALLPALPDIASELVPLSPNKTQFIISSFLLGMGIATLFTGPLSDSFGRKKIIFVGGIIFLFGTVLASTANNLEIVLLGRFIQGLGVAGPRVVTLAIVRDLYAGRRMAQIMSISMIFFTFVPAVAPMIGALLLLNFGWRSIFTGFIVFLIIAVGWLLLRQPETLMIKNRVSFTFTRIYNSFLDCFSNKVFVISTILQTLTFSILFASISTIQQIFDITYDKALSFPYWFGLIALISGSGSLINSYLVVQMGMRKLINLGFMIGIGSSLFLILVNIFYLIPFPLYFVWQLSVFFMIGLIIGNLNAMAMQPMGHIAGLAASIIGSASTIFGVVIAIPIGLSFKNTPDPLIIGILCLSSLSFLILKLLKE